MMPKLNGLRYWMVCLLLALVCLQTLTVVHRVLHKENVSQRATQSLPSHGVLHKPQNEFLNPTSGITTFFADLWSEHKSLSDCQMFDQACPDTLQHALHLDIFIPPPALWMGLVLRERFALFERFYAARGPPVLALI